jgi:hypothetical protein
MGWPGRCDGRSGLRCLGVCACGLRKEEREAGSAAGMGGSGADADAATVFVDEFAGDPEAESGAGVFFGGEEGFEDAGEMLACYALAVVGYGDANAGAGGVSGVGGLSDIDADDGVFGTGIEAVGEEVGEDLAKLSGCAQDFHLCVSVGDELDSASEGAG